ncbi:cupin domain-containing protein [Streptomyces sp. WAC05374]|uniref:cupin domain-containing protein n=1 Tax=Streptomyces sp. WAC05374 TaxID=2487420 RepID=UPI000F85D95C|nr:cupin domain-containing protein [Streptomyces sp. WAC05374]RST16429.1 cupin domain-containing protein [Streptomyces sp. WAC05374]TDF43572.1 cupin domain-containing protein [Streptomyces sp. WAC05374]TDF51526.1 cupin domain-containing protein [Streptomyces sp. WAC05374]TDF53319.1 cupin domain-containing protein [Streptomyces sp. WAC05374]
MTGNGEAAEVARAGELFHDVPAGRGGALWRLAADGRQLDANLIRVTPDTRVPAHVEPDLDVFLYVVDGEGRLDTGSGEQPLAAGSVVWLPRGARRGVVAGPGGLTYLTVHRRRPGLTIRSAAAPEGGEAACLLHRVCPECGRLAPDGSDVRFCGRCGTRLPEE